MTRLRIVCKNLQHFMGVFPDTPVQLSTMNCTDIRKKLNAFFDEELPAREMEEVGNHLQTCIACREILDGLRSIGEALDRHAVPGMPEGFTRRIMEKARKREAEPPKRSAPLAWVQLGWWKELSIGMRLVAASVLLLGSLIGGGMALALTGEDGPFSGAPSIPLSDVPASIEGIDSFLVTSPGAFTETYISLHSPPTESVTRRNGP